MEWLIKRLQPKIEPLQLRLTPFADNFHRIGFHKVWLQTSMYGRSKYLVEQEKDQTGCKKKFKIIYLN